MEKQIEEIKRLARDIFEPKVALDGIDLAFAAVHGADRDNETHFMRIARHLYMAIYDAKTRKFSYPEEESEDTE